MERRRRGCGKVGIPRLLRDFQAEWKTCLRFSPLTSRANSSGVRYPRLLCGRSSLYSRRHTAILSRASNRFPNQLTFKHSSRIRPLKLSTRPFPIAEPRLFPCQLHQPHSQPFIAAPALIPVTRYRHGQQPTGPPLAEGILFAHLPHSRLHDCELHPFFRITDCNASLSKLRSATSFLSRAFSSRNCFTSCASLTSIPPYFAVQA